MGCSYNDNTIPSIRAKKPYSFFGLYHLKMVDAVWWELLYPEGCWLQNAVHYVQGSNCCWWRTMGADVAKDARDC